MHSCQLRQAPKCGRAPSRKIFPDNPIFQNQKIGKSGKFFCKIRFNRDLFSGNQGIFHPDFPKSGNFAVPFFQNLNIFFRKSENFWKCGRCGRKSWKCGRFGGIFFTREKWLACRSLPLNAGELTAMRMIYRTPNQSLRLQKCKLYDSHEYSYKCFFHLAQMYNVRKSEKVINQQYIIPSK